MPIVTELSFSADLDKGITMTPLQAAFLMGNSEAHRIRVNCMKHNRRLDLSESGVTAYMIRADGATIPMEGTTFGSEALVTLPAACYAVQGRFSLVVNISQGDTINTVLWAEGAVSRSRTDLVIDPESVIPSLDELLAQIENMKAATQAALDAAASVDPDKLRPATQDSLGVVKVGSGLGITSDGTIYATSQSGGGGVGIVSITIEEVL